MHINLLDPIYKSYCPNRPTSSRVIWSTSQGHFHWKCYNLSMLHSMTIKLISMLISLRRSTCTMGSHVNPGSFGVTGVKRSFSLKCYNSSMLYSMMMISLKILYRYLCYEVTCQSAVNWFPACGIRQPSLLVFNLFLFFIFQTLINMMG